MERTQPEFDPALITITVDGQTVRVSEIEFVYGCENCGAIDCRMTMEDGRKILATFLTRKGKGK